MKRGRHLRCSGQKWMGHFCRRAAGSEPLGQKGFSYLTRFYDLKEFVGLQSTLAETEKSWFLYVTDVDPDTFDLSVKNPNALEEAPLHDPQEIMDEIAALDAESSKILAGIGKCCDEEGSDKKVERCLHSSNRK